MRLTKSYNFIKKDLIEVESILEELVYSDHTVLHKASDQLLKAGGKRLRPLFVLLSSRFGEFNLDHVKKVASSLELIHMASLVHDDVIDDSDMRRGKPTVKASWDNQVAMLTGDYIFAKAIGQLSAISEPRLHQILADTMIELTIGEIEQIKDKYVINQNLRTYLRRIKRKTALLISSSCQLGAIVTKTSPMVEESLFRYGYYIGMSYQIIDDILDFTGTEKDLGKPAGGDLLQGNITLPVLYAMEDPTLKEKLAFAFQDTAKIDEKEVSSITKEIAKSSAITKSRELSNLYLKKAYEALERLPDNDAKEALQYIANYIGQRKT
ncbi:heptaprenyl diphosphate synthase [Gracilibacillus halotolerans]|uniref:Heptaprenyl diphosphate synthase component 2 n=1 Tax=Gracilibacillus halotolerans TaxID=74386 RepID=A0A841RJ28_9BACI|nr:heptaprenyl diphosphate synthase component II [Gracilibacillus halotolerans]MBB6511653.1 heptaprenyl diphosphate synthase [Gracilibacillus halotolerans]